MDTIRRGFNEFRGRITDLKHADVVNAVRRAVRAYEVGREMTENPDRDHAPRAHDLPHKPVLDIRRTGRFEYRAVVRATGHGTHFETLVTVHSREFLSGEEVFELAREAFWAEVPLEDKYRRRVADVGTDARTDVWIVSATRHQPGRE